MDDSCHDVSVSAAALVAGHIALKAQLRSAVRTRLSRALKREGGKIEERLLQKLPSIVLIVWKQRDPNEPCVLVVKRMVGKALSMVQMDLKSEFERAAVGLKTLSLDEPLAHGEARLKNLADPSRASPEDLILFEDTKAALKKRATLAGFSPDETAVFKLKMADPEISNEEIANLLDKPPNQIAQYVSRYRQKLRSVGADKLMG